jgi:glycosyltransferase involved in cell wall biosynthesis
MLGTNSSALSFLPDFTAIVVTYNEDRRLGECLESLSFSDELLVVDLGSVDRSIEIAKSHGATVLHHERLPVVEKVRARVIDQASNDWVLFIDPDEVFCPSLLDDAAPLFDASSDIGRIFFPWKFYFRSRPLTGTKWGGEKYKGVLIHRDRCRLAGDVHRGIDLREGFRAAQVSWDEASGHIRHYWMDSYRQLIEKHLRYIQQEGEARYNQGERFSWRRFCHESLAAFKHSLIDHEGWREGLRGLLLSAFWAWYHGASLLSLRRYRMSMTDDEV